MVFSVIELLLLMHIGNPMVRFPFLLFRPGDFEHFSFQKFLCNLDDIIMAREEWLFVLFSVLSSGYSFKKTSFSGHLNKELDLV